VKKIHHTSFELVKEAKHTARIGYLTPYGFYDDGDRSKPTAAIVAVESATTIPCDDDMLDDCQYC
jgi:hypothetical protein